MSKEDFEDYFSKAFSILEDAENVDKTEIREILVPIIFLKVASDSREDKYQEILEDVGDEELANDPSFYRVQISDECLWSELAQQTDRIDEFLNNAFNEIEKKNENLDGIFSTNFMDLDVSNETLEAIIQQLDTHNLSLEKVDTEALSDAYRYLVQKFADQEDRDAGDFYQPKEVIELMMDILGPFKEDDKFNDPFAGSGDMLVGVGQYFQSEQERNPKRLHITGQESIKGGLALSKTNFLINDLLGTETMKTGNPLNYPFVKDSELETFDYIITNFPYSDSWEKEDLTDPYNRINWPGTLPAKNKADYAYLMHMESALKEKGKIATLAPHGVLFRDNEESFRKHMIDEDLVELVVGLPEGLFGEDNDIAPVLLVLNKDKPEERKDEVFFIHANDEGFYEEQGKKNTLSKTGQEKIQDLIEDRESIDRLCTVANKEQIESYDHNLNIALYVDTTEPEEPVETVKEAEKLDKKDKELENLKQTIRHDLSEIYSDYSPEDV